MNISPLPWHVSTNGCTLESGGEPAFPGVRDSSGLPHGEDFVCVCLGLSDECKANSAYIVKACNSHDQLVEALKLITNGGGTPKERKRFCKSEGIDTADADSIARAALMKLNKKTL